MLMQALRDLTGQPRWDFKLSRSYGVKCAGSTQSSGVGHVH
jgi:hypothetical protein